MPSSLSFLLYKNSDLPLKTQARSSTNNNRGINSYPYTNSALEHPTKVNASYVSNSNGITQGRESLRNRLARYSIVSDSIWRRHNIRNDIKSVKPEPLKMASNENSFVSAKRRREAFSPCWRESASENFDSTTSISNLPTNTKNDRTTVQFPIQSNSLPLSMTSHSTRIPEKRQISSLDPNPVQFFATDDQSKQPLPIIRSKIVSSSANNPSPSKLNQNPLSSSDDNSEDEVETNNLKEDDLKRKLKEEKRQSKRTAEILHKLHENYEELLEKYAQAENTIDQLRFQPNNSRFLSKSNGICPSTSDPPLSSIQPESLSTTSTIKSK
ncbi:unnamed protein product [Adineta ricciae]|uniref:Uncharacterized protein n=1 Tax=Adineta ricciae TaxID=249248 RepID=A0A814E3A0_ADIRI|nr:unnamed protein product [Adineta ricciae]CAF1618998.1 unnamed protein product [Adineta ricciae]